jgi:hypothetical protein
MDRVSISDKPDKPGQTNSVRRHNPDNSGHLPIKVSSCPVSEFRRKAFSARRQSKEIETAKARVTLMVLFAVHIARLFRSASHTPELLDCPASAGLGAFDQYRRWVLAWVLSMKACRQALEQIHVCPMLPPISFFGGARLRLAGAIVRPGRMGPLWISRGWGEKSGPGQNLTYHLPIARLVENLWCESSTRPLKAAP